MPAGRSHTALREGVRSLLQQRFGYALLDERADACVDVLHEHGSGLGGAHAALASFSTLPLEAPLVQALIACSNHRTSPPPRQTAALETLRREVLPRTLERCASSRTVRVWCAGCGPGGEVFAIALLLRELLPEIHRWRVAVVGTDIDARALTRAQSGEVSVESLRGIPPRVREQYFEAAGAGLVRVSERFRRALRFELHNLLDPDSPAPSPGQFDLVLCRNVARHCHDVAWTTLVGRLRGALRPGGEWFASSTDPPPGVGFETTRLHGGLLHAPTFSDAPAAPTSPACRPGSDGPPPRLALPSTVPDALREVQAQVDSGDLGAAAAQLSSLRPEAWAQAPTHRVAAMVYEAMGRSADARTALERALSLDPGSADTQLRLGLMRARVGDLEGALEALERAASTQPEHATADALAVARVARAQLARLRRAR